MCQVQSDQYSRVHTDQHYLVTVAKRVDNNLSVDQYLCHGQDERTALCARESEGLFSNLFLEKFPNLLQRKNENIDP